MIKTTGFLLVSLSTLAACADQQPAQSPQSASPAMTSAPAGGPGMGATEPMPSTSGSGTAYAAPGTPRAPPNESVTTSGPQTTATMTAPSSAAVTTAWTEGKILQVIHSANDGEIEQAKLARIKASDPRVKQFAAMMIKDHSAADDKTLAVAKQSASSFEPTPESQNLEADVRGNTSTLSAQTGSGFDREYIETQISEHQAVLATIDNELMPAAQSGDVKTLLTAVRSKTMAHLQQAQDLAAAMQKK